MQINLNPILKRKFWQLFPYLLSIALVVVLALTIEQSQKMITENATLKESKKHFEEKVVDLSYQNKELQTKYDVVEKQNKTLTTEIAASKKALKNLKTKYNEKINGVDSYSNSELELFFTNRYNQSGTSE